jgi:hypothetical protein
MTVVKFKRSSVTGRVPTTSDLVGGEIALNTTDGKLFFKKTVGSTSTIVPLSPMSVGVISGGSILNDQININALRFDSDGFVVTSLSGGATKIVASTFKTWQVDGQAALNPTGADTVKFVAGSGIQISTNATSTVKTITIESVIAATTATAAVSLYQDGNLTLKTGTIRWYAPRTINIYKIIARLAASADSTVSVVTKKSGITSNTINFSTGTTRVELTTNIDMVIDDYLTVDVTQIGTPGGPGNGLSVEYKYSIP